MRRRIISLTLSLSLLFQYSGFAQGQAQLNLAQYLSQMPRAGSDKFRPLHMRYFSYDPQSNDFDLLLDKGDEKGLKDDELKEKTAKLLEYFKIGLALPNDKFWVNLRPDAPDEIIDPDLEKTDIGRILLEADLQLKKDTAAWTSPQNPEGKAYWDKLYKKAGELFGSENITIPTITRPWIVPNEVIIHYSENSAYLYKASLKVMLEEDYLSRGGFEPALTSGGSRTAPTHQQYAFSDPRLKELNQYSTQLIKELIIPQLTKEVNTSRRYAQLRQVFYSLALAQWFKKKYSSLGNIRASGISASVNSYINLIDSGNIADFTSSQPCDKQAYFRQYRESFQAGEYNLKEPVYGMSGQTIRSYTSGGILGDTTGAQTAVKANSPLIPKGIDVIDPNNGLIGEHNSAAYARPLSSDILRKPESIKEGKDWLIKNEYIFGGGYGYDIRINDAAGFAEAASKGFYVMGRVLGKKLREDDMFGNPKALITADQRGTSGTLRLALAQGLLDEGIEVTTQADTQAINTALSSEKGLAEDFDLAIQITGSHNPKQANGAKIMYKSLPFYAGALDVSAKDKNNPDKYKNSLRYQIEEYGWFLEKNINNPQGKAVTGKLTVDANLIPKHIEALNKVLPDISNPQSVIADFRNGCGAEVFMGVAKAKGYRVIKLSSADAELPKEVFDSKEPVLIALNTRPSALMDAGIWDPSKPEAFDGIRKLQQRIYNDPRFQGKKLAGVALDGDGDRSGAVTEGDKDSPGELIMPERMLISFYRRMILDNIAGIKSLNRLGHTVKLALDVRSFGVVIDVLKELSKEFGIRAEGEFIAAGFPNHRAFVFEELETIARLLQDNQGSSELMEYDQEAIKKLMLSYTSAEASGHFFFNVLSPEQFLEKKIVVDDGITSFFMYLHLVGTMDKYELAGEENPDKTFAQADSLSSKRPVTDEVRLEKAPADVDKKQQLAEEIMRQFIKDNPELLPVSLEGFEKKANEARNSPPKRQNALEDLLLVDGIRLKLKNGVWILLRKSNTSAVIVFKAEAASNEKRFELLRVLRLLSQAINKAKDSSPDFQGLEIGKFNQEIKRLEQDIAFSTEYFSSLLTKERFDSRLNSLYGLNKEEAVKADLRLAKIGFDGQANRLGWTMENLRWILNNYDKVENILKDADDIRNKFKHVIFCGMGGSGLSVQLVKDTFGEKEVKIYSLRNTDPGAIKEILSQIEGAGGSLNEVLVIPISKSGTTEETVKHKEYFENLFNKSGLDVKKHIGVITDQGSPMSKGGYNQRDIQLNGEGDIGGRFTSPTTNIFLLPLALVAPERIRPILELALKMNEAKDPRNDVFLNLGAFLYYMAAHQGKDKVTMLMPEELKAIPMWAEQLFEESLGKGGKGVSVFYGENLSANELRPVGESDRVFLSINIAGKKTNPKFWNYIKERNYPLFEIDVESVDSIGGIMLGLQRATAAIGYLWDICFVNQPAVEGYKNETRKVMEAFGGAEVKVPQEWGHSAYRSLNMHYGHLLESGIIEKTELDKELERLGYGRENAPAVYAAIINILSSRPGFEAAEVAHFGSMPEGLRDVMEKAVYDIYTSRLKMPCKLGIRPDGNHAYHQNIEGGKPMWFSAFTMANVLNQPDGAEFNPNLLKAQAIGTVAALKAVKRPAILIVFARTTEESASDTKMFFADVAEILSKQSSSALALNSGGVDLTRIGRVTQTRLGMDAVNSLMVGAVKINLAQEEGYLSRLMDAQVLPLPQRVMNFAASSSLEGYSREKAQDMLVNYLRLEERFAVETPDELKQFLSAIQPLWESSETMYSDE